MNKSDYERWTRYYQSVNIPLYTPSPTHPNWVVTEVINGHLFTDIRYSNSDYYTFNPVED